MRECDNPGETCGSFGNRSSDQAEPDKTYGFHDVCVLSSYYLSISRQTMVRILKDTRKNVKHRYKIGEFDELIAKTAQKKVVKII